jgi:hypothetical protein
VKFDAHVPNSARMWNYWLDGKDHFAADRDLGDKISAVLPTMPRIARLARHCLTSVVYELVSMHGITQFIDLGSGLPTADNTHEVAQRADPAARIVYVDHDPVARNHGQVLLTSCPEGRTDYLLADMRDTAAVLDGAARTLDFSRPVALLFMASLHFIPDSDDPYDVVRRLLDPLVPGSYLMIGHGASDMEPVAAAELTRLYNESSPTKIQMRSRQEILRFFDGLEFTGRGLLPMSQWWETSPAETDTASGLLGYVGIARKPLIIIDNGGGRLFRPAAAWHPGAPPEAAAPVPHGSGVCDV